MMKVYQMNTIINGYQIIEFIGVGASGVVYKVRSMNNNNIYALKHSKTFSADEEELMRYLSKVTMKNIVNVIQHWVQQIGYNEELYVVMDYCSEGNLLQQNSKKLPQFTIDKYVLQLLQAVDQMHSNFLIHRDIKPENIVFEQDTLKLCDFGLSRYNAEGVGMTKQIGTPYYMAPELITATMTYQNYTNTIDCWAVGCIIYELYKQEPLFSGNTIQEVQLKIVNYQKILRWKTQLSEAITNKEHLKVVQGFIQPANQRISAKEALKIMTMEPKIKIIQKIPIFIQQPPQAVQFDLQQSKCLIKQGIQVQKTDPIVLKVSLQSLIKADRDPQHPNSQLVKRCVDGASIDSSIIAKKEIIVDTVMQFLKKELKYV